jgi:hypothetical protein
MVDGDTIQLTFDYQGGFFHIHTPSKFRANIGTHCHNFDTRCNWSQSSSPGLFAVGGNPTSVAEIVATESGNLTLTVGYQSLQSCANLTVRSIGAISNLTVRNQAPFCVVQADVGQAVLGSAPLHDNMAVDGYMASEYHRHWDESQQVPNRTIGMLAFRFSALQTGTFAPLSGVQNLVEFMGTTSEVVAIGVGWDGLRGVPGVWIEGGWTRMEPGRYVPPIDKQVVVIVAAVVGAIVVVAIVVGAFVCWRVKVRNRAGLQATTLTLEPTVSTTGGYV